MENNKYQLLMGAEKVRQNIGLFIGGKATPTQLAIEIIDNSIDEVLRKNANYINIIFNDEENTISVIDNGSGFDIYDMKTESNELKDSVEVLCTELHSGSNFESNDTKKMTVTAGLHGVGMCVTNALSDWMTIKTRKKNDLSTAHFYEFSDFNLVSKTKLKNQNVDEPWSTIITFKPSKRFFDDLFIDKALIIQKLMLAQSKYNFVKFLINNKELPKFTLKEFALNKLQLDKECKNLHSFKIERKNKFNQKLIIESFITFIEDQNNIIYSEVNLKECSGTFINNYRDILTKRIIEKLDKKYKDISDTILLLGLRLYVSLTLELRLEFDSQTKIRLSLELYEDLMKHIEPEIIKFLNNDNIIDIIKRNIELKFNKKTYNTRKAKRTSIGNKLKDSINIPGKTLYIVEGDSAAGTLDQIRDKYSEGLYPCRGKSLNVLTSTVKKINDNKEISDIKEALGPINNRRYEEIVLLPDADADGLHIGVLNTFLLQYIAVDYISANKVAIILTPLYSATNKKEYIPIYKQDDCDKYLSLGYNITRFKGLGEMNPNELEFVINNGIKYQIQLPNEEELESLKSIITENESKQLLLNNDKLSLITILNSVLASKSNILNV